MSFQPLDKAQLIAAVNGWCSDPKNTIPFDDVPIND